MATDIWVELPDSGGGGGGSVNSVTASGPLQSSGGANPNISLILQDPFTFAGYDSTGLLSEVPGWHFDSIGQAQAFINTPFPADNINSFQVGVTLDTPLTGGYEGFIVSLDASSSMIYNSSFNAENNYQSTFSIAGGISQFNDQSNFNAGATAGNYSSFSAFPTIAGNSNYTAFSGAGNLTNTTNGTSIISVGVNFNSGYTNTGGTIGYNDASNLNVGASTQNYVSYNADPNIAGTITTQYAGLTVSPNITGTVADFNGVNISPNGTVTGNANGININMDNITDSNPQGAVAIQSGGRISVNGSSNLVSAQQFQIGSRLEHVFLIPNGSPVTGTDSLGVNLAGDLLAQDNIALGPLGLGYISVSALTDMGVAVGKTVASTTALLAGVALPDPGYTTGGAITDVNMVRIIPPLSEGGTAVITNLYAVKLDELFGPFGTGVTNAYGLYFNDSSIQNIIGGALSTQTHTVSTTYTVDATQKDNVIFADTSGAAFTITLPSPTAGRNLTFKDSTGSFGTNNLTLNAGAAKIDGVAGTSVYSVNFMSIELISNGTDWFVL